MQVVVLGGGSFGTAMAAHVAAKKADLEVSMLLRDDLVCRSINHSHINWFVIVVAASFGPFFICAEKTVFYIPERLPLILRRCISID